MQAIPTEYNGLIFRSRLEARWAMFFDQIGWAWEYEPDILNNIGWLPDFMLFGEQENILVEVKPFFHFDEWKTTISKINQTLLNTFYKNTEVLLLGGSLIKRKNTEVALGFLLEQIDNAISTSKETAIFRGSKYKFGFHSEYGSYHCRITGLYDGNTYVGLDDEDYLILSWNKTNEVGRYKSPKINYELYEKELKILFNEEFRKCGNGKTHHYVFSNCYLYPPRWTIFDKKSLTRIEPKSFDDAVYIIKQRGLAW